MYLDEHFQQEHQNPQHLSPEDLNPEELNPEELNPEELNPEELNPEELNPENHRNQPRGFGDQMIVFDLTKESTWTWMAQATGHAVAMVFADYV